jgi:peptidoglycan hydrolase CwlO-like protein
MGLQRATKEGVLELDRISAKIGSTVNAVWGTVEGDITKQTDLQNELQGIKDVVNTKVDKVNGKQLSTEDYTTPEKQKLAGLSNYDDSALRKYVESLEEQNKLLKEQVAALQNQIDNTGWILLE